MHDVCAVLCAVQWWHDYQLQWDPDQLGIEYSLRIDPNRVWTPDIVLFNKYTTHCILNCILYCTHRNNFGNNNTK